MSAACRACGTPLEPHEMRRSVGDYPLCVDIPGCVERMAGGQTRARGANENPDPAGETADQEGGGE